MVIFECHNKAGDSSLVSGIRPHLSDKVIVLFLTQMETEFLRFKYSTRGRVRNDCKTVGSCGGFDPSPLVDMLK